MSVTPYEAFVDGLLADPVALEKLRAGLQPAPERLLTAKEAADVLGVHVETLHRYRREGRVLGAEQVTEQRFGYRLSELKMLPPAHLTIAPTPGRGVRRPGTSGATDAIRNAANKRAA